MDSDKQSAANSTLLRKQRRSVLQIAMIMPII